MTELKQIASRRVLIVCSLILGCVYSAVADLRPAQEIRSPTAEKGAPLSMAFGKDGALFTFYKAKAGPSDRQVWHLLKVAQPLSKSRTQSDVEVFSDVQTATTLFKASARLLLSSDRNVLLCVRGGYSAKGQSDEKLFTIDTQDLRVLAHLDIVGLGLENPRLIGFSRNGTVLVSSVPRLRFSELTILEFDARTLKELNRRTLPLESTADFCEPMSIGSAWCKAAALSEAKSAKLFDAGGRPQSKTSISLPESYGGVQSITSTASGLLIIASQQDPKTFSPTGIRLFLRHDRSAELSASPVLPPCDVTNVRISLDQRVGLFDCSVTRRSVLDTYYTAQKNTVVFLVDSLQTLAEIPESKAGRVSEAIWHGAGEAVVAVYEDNRKLLLYTVPER
jgi:hypothetical protein